MVCHVLKEVKIWGQVRLVWKHLEQQPIRPDIYQTDSALEQQTLLQLVAYLHVSKECFREVEWFEKPKDTGERSFFHGERRHWSMSDFLQHVTGLGSEGTTTVAVLLRARIDRLEKEQSAAMSKVDQEPWDNFLRQIQLDVKELGQAAVNEPVEPLVTHWVRVN